MKKMFLLALAAACLFSCKKAEQQQFPSVSFGYDNLIISQIDDQTYLVNDNYACTMYLVLGKKKALLIDTGNGDADIPSWIRTVTDLPLTVVCTHAHPDHIAGNYFFSEVLIPAEDQEAHDAYWQNGMPKSADSLIAAEIAALPAPKSVAIHVGDQIDLGGRVLTAYCLPGHTPGSYLFADPSHDILFSGDALNGWLWMQFGSCPPLSEFAGMLDDFLATPELTSLHWMYGGHEQRVGYKTTDYASVIRNHLDEIFAGTADYTMIEQWGHQVVIYEFDDWRLFTTPEEFARYGGANLLDEPKLKD